MNNSHDLPEQPAESQQPHPSQPGSEQSNPEHPSTAQFPPPLPQPESAKFFQWLRGLGIQRGSSRWMGGVCSGLANKWGIDPVIVRGAAVVLTLFFGLGLLAYGAAWALLPEPDGRIHAEEVARGRWSSGMTGAAILAFLGLVGPGQGVFFDDRDMWFLWPVFWIAGAVGAYVWYSSNKKSAASKIQPGTEKIGPDAPTEPGTDPSWYGHTWKASNYAPSSPPASFQQPAPYVQQPYMPNPQMYVKTAPRPVKPRLGAAGSLLVIGAAAVVGAAILLLGASNVIHLGGYEEAVAAAAAAITAGLGIVIAGATGRTAGGLGTFSIITLIVAGLLSLPPQNLSAFNESTWAPTSISAAEAGRTILLGNTTIDLTMLDGGSPLSSDVEIPVNVAAASLTIVVPSNIPVQLKSELAAASLTIDGKGSDGTLTGSSTTDVNPGAKGHGIVIVLEAAATNIDVQVETTP